MTEELRVRNPAQQIYVRALSAAWRNGVQLYDPSVWLMREPEIEEKMLRDADIAHAVGFRRHLIAGRQWTIVAPNAASPRAPLATFVAKSLVEKIQAFTSVRLNLARAFFSGARFGRINGEYQRLRLGDGVERTWWVPRRVEDVDKRMMRIVPTLDPMTEELTAHWERWNLARDEFEIETQDDACSTIRHVYQDDQGQLGYGRALREALGWWWYAKTQVFGESLQAVERFAQGILHARIDGIRDAATNKPNAELIAAWRDVLQDLRSRHVLVSDKADEIDVISGSAEGWQLLGEIRQELRSTIITLVLGANLTTAADDGGSYALAKIQENSTEALVQFDRGTLEETLTDDLLGCIWKKNYANLVELGIESEPVAFSITQEKLQDPRERGDVAAVLNGMGVRLSLSDVLEQTGFRAPEDGEEIIEGRTAPAASLGGFNGVDLGFKR